MADYTVTYSDIVTGTVYGELPASELGFTDVLSAPGSWDVTIPIDYETRTGVQIIAPGTLDVERTAVHIERDGNVMMSGPLHGIDIDVKENAIKLSGEGWHSILRRRLLYGDDFAYTLLNLPPDQATVIKNLIVWAQAQPGGDLRIDTSAISTTGVTQAVSFPGSDYSTIGEDIEKFTEFKNGIDFVYSTSVVNGVYTPKIRLLYPRLGHVVPIVYELGSNVELFRLTVDGTRMANDVWAFGQGSGSAKTAARAVDTNLLRSYPALCGTVTDNSDTSWTIQSVANRRLDTVKRPIIIPEVEIDPDSPEGGLGSYSLGDTVRVVGEYGFLSIDDQYRITSTDVKVDRSGKETVRLTLAPAYIWEDNI